MNLQIQLKKENSYLKKKEIHQIPQKNQAIPRPFQPLIPQVITMCYNRNAVKVWIINIGDIKTTCSTTTYSTTRQF